MQRVIVLTITSWVWLALVGRTSEGHVAPSVDDNNRYLKVTPAADRVRLAYTVFFGEVPGAQLRRTLDANRDGQISDGEAHTFGTKLALEVAAALEVTVDGTTRPVTWSTVAVGMGTPAVTAGSFSVDMVAWICLPSARGRHTLLLRDQFRVPKPGETEVKIEDGLGITIERARVGPANDPSRDYKFIGPGGPLSDDGLDVVFSASDKAPLGDRACGAAATGGTGGLSAFVIAGIVLASGAVLGSLVLLRARRRTARPKRTVR